MENSEGEKGSLTKDKKETNANPEKKK